MGPMKNPQTLFASIAVIILRLFFSLPFCWAESPPLDDFSSEILVLARQCRQDVEQEFHHILETNTLTFNQLFDTFYIPIPGTHPQKYTTQYDKITDERIRIILDKYLEKDPRLIYVVAVDSNGYLPTHNSKYSQPLTDDPAYNIEHNRTKRIFNGRAGLAAARNKQRFLLQTYNRETGNTFYDLSVPIFVNSHHWGAIRVGFRRN